MDYHNFINNKKHNLGSFGFDPVYMPEMAFDFQEHVIEKSVQKGRIGSFCDTGLGKTLMQLAFAFNIVKKTNRPVTHPCGLKKYFGETPILPNILQAWNNANDSDMSADELWKSLNHMYADHEDPKSNKLSHYIWQRYASSVWDDIRIDNVLPFRDSKEEDDEKHVHPLQLDVIDRLVELYSNPDEVVLTPFMGVGSEVYSPVSLGRKSIGVELKDSYYKQAILNLKEAETRFSAQEQRGLF